MLKCRREDGVEMPRAAVIAAKAARDAQPGRHRQPASPAGGGGAGLVYGGFVVIQHLALRCILWRSGALPLHLVAFLDYCAEPIFLRKVGGGYVFVHGLLMEHFAAMGSERPIAPFSLSQPSDLTNRRAYAAGATRPSASVDGKGRRSMTGGPVHWRRRLASRQRRAAGASPHCAASPCADGAGALSATPWWLSDGLSTPPSASPSILQ